MVLAIMQAAAAEALTATDAEQASFFGYIGIAIALCFASKCFSIRPLEVGTTLTLRRFGSSVRNREVRSGHLLHGCARPRADFQIDRSCYHGWYSWNLWLDHLTADLPENGL